MRDETDAGVPDTVADPSDGAPTLQRTADAAASLPSDHAWPDAPDYGELREHDEADFADGRMLAFGGMGRIWSVRDRRLGRRVAVREVLDSEAGLATLEREALITARLQHPNIIHVYEAGRWPSGAPFFVMNLVAGRPLDRVIGEAGSAVARLGLVSHVVAVVDALAYAHSQGIIHRDLKPGNVLVGSFGETVVIDWGLAKDLAHPHDPPPLRTASHASDATIEGAVIGTPAYMPAEQAAGRPVNATADA